MKKDKTSNISSQKNEEQLTKAEKKAAKLAEKQKSKKEKHKILHEKSQLAIDNNIRVSSPYGYYPDDVERVINTLNVTIKNLSNENTALNKQLKDKEHELDEAKRNIDSLRQSIQNNMLSSFVDVGEDYSEEYAAQSINDLADITGGEKENDSKVLAAANILATLGDDLYPEEPDPIPQQPQQPIKPVFKLNFKKS